MNILVLSWRDHLHPQSGGAEQVMREHIKGWVKEGNKVTLFSSRFIGSKKYEKSEGVEIFHSGDQYLGVKLEAFKFWSKYGKNYDLVVDQFHGIPFFTPLYVNKPKLAVLQELAREVWFLNGFPFPLNLIIGLLGYAVEPFIFLFYKNIPFMVGSNSAKMDLVKVGIKSKNISVVFHGIILNHKKTKMEKENTKTVIFLGALTKDKGIEDAIKSFGLLNKIGQFRFWVAGKGGRRYVKYLKSQSRKLGVKVKIWGYINDPEKFNLLSRAHVLINPSAREGWGLVNVEANSVGTPVVAYRSQGLVDSVSEGESGVFCKNNYKDMAVTVDKLLNNYGKYTLLSEKSRKWAAQFDWRLSRNKSLKLIRKLIKK